MTETTNNNGINDEVIREILERLKIDTDTINSLYEFNRGRYLEIVYAEIDHAKFSRIDIRGSLIRICGLGRTHSK